MKFHCQRYSITEDIKHLQIAKLDLAYLAEIKIQNIVPSSKQTTGKIYSTTNAF